MSDNYDTIIDQDWDELALDDGTIVDEFGTYSARIYPRDGTGADTLDSQVENISYSPKVNSAKGISVDVEPLSALEGEDYLGGIVDVFVNNRPLFSGKIYKISTSSEEGTYYSIEAEPPAKELRNETINENTDNYLLSDYCAKTIDKFNGFDDEHFNLIDTADESLTDINKFNRGREATSDSATVTYSGVGSDASNIDILYVKLLVNGSVDVTINTANSSYSETFTSSEGTYGDWFKIEPSGLDKEQYDIKYSLESGSTLYDWISITSSKVTRTIEPEVAELVRQQETIQDASTDSEWEDVLDIKDTQPYSIDNGQLVFEQTGFFFEAENNTDGNTSSDVNFSDGSAAEFFDLASDIDVAFDLDYEIPAGNAALAIRYRVGNNGEPEYVGQIDGTEVSQSLSGGGSTTLEWQIEGSIGTALSPGSHTASLKVEDVGGNGTAASGDMEVDCVFVFDDRYYDISNFDNQVNQDNGYLDNPFLYAKNTTEKINFSEVTVGEVVQTAYLDVDTDGSNVAELSVSFDSGTSFKSSTDTNSIQKDNNGLTSSVIGRIELEGWEENGERNDTPRLGYSPQKVNLYDLSVDTNNIEVLFNSDPSGNRLKVITDIIDNSRLYYRVEGSDIRIFGRGDKKTNVDLRKENVTSSVSIDNVYSSCEVIGDNVTSGVIQADNAPSYVDRHKEIRDPDITNTDDATRRARSFLEENSTIEYEGDITTLPTLAPLGEQIDGSIFSHGKDSFIESVRYGKRRTGIDVGRTKQLQDELLNLDRSTSSTNTRDTST